MAHFSIQKNRTKDTFTAHNTLDNYTAEINRHDILAQGDLYSLAVGTLAMKPIEQEYKSEADIEAEFNEHAREVLETSLKRIETTIKIYRVMARVDIRQPAYFKEYLERANAIITKALGELQCELFPQEQAYTDQDTCFCSR